MNGMWNKYDMMPSVAINATQLIAIEAATVRHRVNADTAVHAHNIFLRHLGTFITNTMVCCKSRFSECSPVNGPGRSTMRL
jgi:hypothetical protein